MRPLRIAFGRIAQETNALSPVLTRLEDFEGAHYLEGAPLLSACAPWRTEARGFMRNAELSGFTFAARRDRAIEPVPLISAWTVPGGPLERRCFETLRDRMVARLREAGPVDGVMLSLHGAMGASGVLRPDAEIVRAVREVVGPRAKIAVTLDLHGNLSKPLVEGADLIVAYRTNPHRDLARAGYKAGALLASAIRGDTRPAVAWRSLPMILGGGNTLDFLRPMRSVFSRMKEMERDPRVLTASTLMVHPWNDDPELGWSTYVATDGDPDLAERLADELAERCWAVRDEQPPAFTSASEAIAEARRAKLHRRFGVVTLSDASDVVTAGAPGENTRLLAHLLEEAPDLRSYVPLRDPAAVESLWREEIGARVALVVGGKLDPAGGEGLRVAGTVAGKRTPFGVGRTVVLAIGELRLILTEGPALAIRPSFFAGAGLDPWKADVIVVKNFFLFRMFFLAHSRKTLYVRTSGLTDLDAAFRLPFARPVHPRDPVAEWREADRERRHGSPTAPQPLREPRAEA